MNEARYDRQSLLPEIGAAGQRRLANARVLCIGAGGLGCGALPYLAAAGIGRITILDDDRVEESNLQRQVLFMESDLGRPKAEAAADQLAARNSCIEVQARCERLGIHNVRELFEDHDVIVEGSDNFATKYLANDAGVKFGVPVVYASAIGFEAQVTVFDADHGPCLRCLFPEPPTGWVPNCAEAGVLGPLVGMAGTIQAAETIKLLVSEPGTGDLDSLTGRMWLLDARSMRPRQLPIEKNPECPVCSRPPKGIELVGADHEDEIDIPPGEISDPGEVELIDVREADEFRTEHIPGARHLPLSQLVAEDIPPPESDRPCVVYCQRGPRGQQAARLLSRQWQREVRNLRGGLAGWTGSREGPTHEDG